MKILLLIVLLVVQAKHCLQAPAEVLNISIYYESLCPYCVRFITERLYPAYQKIGSNLWIDLVPYGNCQRTKEDGEWVYECQHGAEECAINKFQACGLAKNSDQDQQIEFVNCVESLAISNYEDDDYEQLIECATHLNLTGSEILECSRGSEGHVLYGKLADKQGSLAEEVLFVPWILLNGKHDKAFAKAAKKNTLTAACDKFYYKPEGCPQDEYPTNITNVTETPN